MEFVLELLDEDEDPSPDGMDVCHHGVGFDEECEACELEIEADGEGGV